MIKFSRLSLPISALALAAILARWTEVRSTRYRDSSSDLIDEVNLLQLPYFQSYRSHEYSPLVPGNPNESLAMVGVALAFASPCH